MEKIKFLFTIDAVFYIIGRGIIVTGEVNQGEINQGDDLELIGNNTPIKTKCLHIEKRQIFVEKAKQGELIAIRLSNVSRQDVAKGMKLVIKD